LWNGVEPGQLDSGLSAGIGGFFGVLCVMGKALIERFVLFTKKQFHRLVGLVCAGVLSTLVLASPASADPYAKVLVSSFQRTCTNITAAVTANGGPINLRANCLASDGSRVPASIDLRGVHRYGNRIVLHPEVGFSSNLAGCEVTSVNPGRLDVSVGIRCSGTDSTIRVHEVTNVDGSLRYETDKIWDLASLPDAMIRPNGAAIPENVEQAERIEQQILDVLRTGGNGDTTRLAFASVLGDPALYLLSAEPNQVPVVVEISTDYQADGSGSTFTSVMVHRGSQAAKNYFETVLARSDG